MKISKNRYLQGFGIVVLLLALVRVIFPGVAKPKVAAAGAADSTLVAAKDSVASDASSAEISDASADAEGNVAEDLKKDELSVMPDTAQSGKPSIFFDKDGKEVKHRIFSVPHFGNTFPDQQDVQILAATKHGVKPVQNRLEAENSKGKLVYVGSNPFFYVDKLNNSIPYLVPRASVLLQDIGRAYFDSLQIKGIPLHKIIVTSILRTKDDVAKLRTRNGNATEPTTVTRSPNCSLRLGVAIRSTPARLTRVMLVPRLERICIWLMVLPLMPGLVMRIRRVISSLPNCSQSISTCSPSKAMIGSCTAG